MVSYKAVQQNIINRILAITDISNWDFSQYLMSFNKCIEKDESAKRQIADSLLYTLHYIPRNFNQAERQNIKIACHDSKPVYAINIPNLSTHEQKAQYPLDANINLMDVLLMTHANQPTHLSHWELPEDIYVLRLNNILVYFYFDKILQKEVLISDFYNLRDMIYDFLLSKEMIQDSDDLWEEIYERLYLMFSIVSI